MIHYTFKCPYCGKVCGKSVGTVGRSVDFPLDFCLNCHQIYKSRYDNEWECMSPIERALLISSFAYDKRTVAESLVRTANPEYRAFLLKIGCKFYDVDRSKYDENVPLKKTGKLRLFELQFGRVFTIEEETRFGTIHY